MVINQAEAISTVWQQALEAADGREGLGAPQIAELREAVRAGLEAAAELAGAVDAACANGWRAAGGHTRAQGLRTALEDLPAGPQLRAAWLESVLEGDRVSAEAAVALLRGLPPETDDAPAWRKLCALARQQRDRNLPEVGAALLVAERGPAACLPTVALTAFRDGPDDAEDRHAAVAGLGAHDDPAVVPWLVALVRGGALALPAVQGLDRWLRRHPASATAATGETPAGWDAATQALGWAAGIGARGLPPAAIDATLRWMALDGLARAQGAAALPALVGAWLAGGDAPPWYLTFLVERVASVAEVPAGGRVDLPGALAMLRARGMTVAPMAPLAGPDVRLSSPAPRIALAATVQLRSSALPTERVQALLEARAVWDKTLVARGQMMTSMLVTDRTEAADPGPAFAPAHLLLDASTRADLEAAEQAWIAG